MEQGGLFGVHMQNRGRKIGDIWQDEQGMAPIWICNSWLSLRMVGVESYVRFWTLEDIGKKNFEDSVGINRLPQTRLKICPDHQTGILVKPGESTRKF